MGDLTAHLAFFPDRMILEQGQERVVRFQIRGASLLLFLDVPWSASSAPLAVSEAACD